MNSVTNDLLKLLRSPSFGDSEAQALAGHIKLWKERYQLNDHHTEECFTQFAAQLLHAVRTQQMPPATASELLVRLMVFGDTNIPPTLYALQATLKLLEEQQKQSLLRDQLEQDRFLREQMSKSMPTLPDNALHQADDCRYSGRFSTHKRFAR